VAERLPPELIARFDALSIGHEESLKQVVEFYRAQAQIFGAAGAQLRIANKFRDELWHGRIGMGAVATMLMTAVAQLAEKDDGD
jgi:hypothetical protein